MSRVHSVDSATSAGPVKRIAASVATSIAPDIQVQKAKIRNILRRSAVQAKLTVSEPDNEYEREAAETVSVDSGEHTAAQAKLDVSIPDASVRLPGHGGGAEMPEDVRAKMEAAFGVDFSPVRIHEGPHAQAVGALAYTQGTDIHFAPGQYQPTSRRGQELLGHELTHVVQQSQGRVRATTQAYRVDINDDTALEREADEMGAKAAEALRTRRVAERERDALQAGVRAHEPHQLRVHV
jgi:hypothetical protein